MVRRGLRTEPWGTPRATAEVGDRNTLCSVCNNSRLLRVNSSLLFALLWLRNEWFISEENLRTTSWLIKKPHHSEALRPTATMINHTYRQASFTPTDGDFQQLLVFLAFKP